MDLLKLRGMQRSYRNWSEKTNNLVFTFWELVRIITPALKLSTE